MHGSRTAAYRRTERKWHARVTAPALVLVAAAVIAAAIFIFDTVTPYGMAIAVLYVIVVLIAGSFLPPRGILVTAAACAALIVLSYVLQHADVNPADSLGRALMSLSAIGVTTLLLLRNHSAQAMRRKQARRSEERRVGEEGRG